MYRDVTELVASIRKHMHSHGMDASPSSRVMQMCNALVNGDGSARLPIRESSPEYETALESVLDLQMLDWALGVFCHNPPVGLPDQFHRLHKDPVLPQTSNQSPGRDVQFELFVAAACSNAKFTSVTFEEPDVTCHVVDQIFGIAVKRLSSVNQLENRIRQAADQIHACGLPGIVAIDLSRALNPENRRCLNQVENAVFSRLHGEAIGSILTPLETSITKWVRGKGVRGILFHDHHVRLWTDGRWGLDLLVCPINTAIENQQRSREFETFIDAYRHGLPVVDRPSS